MMVHTAQQTLAEVVSAAIRRHQAGDARAMEDLFRAVRPWLHGIGRACRLSTYSADDVAQAMQCLEHNGGIDRLSLAYYADSDVDGNNQYQNFRLEGPGAVLYFRGSPHVHAFIHITMNGDAPLSVGEPLGTNPRVLEGVTVKRLFEDALLDQLGTDFAFYPLESVAGRLRGGPIRTGDIYSLESWQDHVVSVETQGSALRTSFVEELRARGIDPDPRRTYSVSTSGFVAEDPERFLGAVASPRRGGMLRDVVIAHLRERLAMQKASL